MSNIYSNFYLHNMGRIHKELGKFLMISSNCIKADNELVIEIGHNGVV